MKRITPVALALAISLVACNNTVSTSDSKLSSSTTENTDQKNEERTGKQTKKEEKNSGAQILNNISLHTEGSVEVDRAFLSFESGELVPSSNVTSIGKPVFLHLNIARGWKEEMGEVSLGASEKISTDNGTVLLDEADLFKNYASLSADDAKFIRLKAVINSMSGPIDYFVVDYKVWDKNGDGVIKGSYRFYIE